jgi:hypothetical protein
MHRHPSIAASHRSVQRRTGPVECQPDLSIVRLSPGLLALGRRGELVRIAGNVLSTLNPPPAHGLLSATSLLHCRLDCRPAGRGPLNRAVEGRRQCTVYPRRGLPPTSYRRSCSMVPRIVDLRPGAGQPSWWGLPATYCRRPIAVHAAGLLPTGLFRLPPTLSTSAGQPSCHLSVVSRQAWPVNGRLSICRPSTVDHQLS